MRTRLTSLLLTLALLSFPAGGYGQRKKKSKKPVPCATSLRECFKMPEGCPTGDAKLNLLKNRTDKPAGRDVEEMTIRDIVALNQKGTPTRWKRNSERDELARLGEGKGVRATGFLINAHMTGKPETTNCNLPDLPNNDFHLNIVPTKPPGRVTEMTKKELQDAKRAVMKDSLVIEMSPWSRNSRWSLPRLQALSDMFTYVRVTGWLMFDSQHASFAHLPRATAWEIHPVTKFEVCVETKTRCDQDESLWRPLERVR